MDGGSSEQTSVVGEGADHRTRGRARSPAQLNCHGLVSPPLATGTSLEREPGAARVLLLGLGNDLLCDDAIGWRVAAEMRHRLEGRDDIQVMESPEMGLSLLDWVVGCEGLLIVDSIQTGQAPVGFIHEIDLDDLKRLPMVSPHFLGVTEVLALGRELGMPVPSHVRILGIEVEDPHTIALEMTAGLRAAFPEIADRVFTIAASMAD